MRILYFSVISMLAGVYMQVDIITVNTLVGYDVMLCAIANKPYTLTIYER